MVKRPPNVGASPFIWRKTSFLEKTPIFGKASSLKEGRYHYFGGRYPYCSGVLAFGRPHIKRGASN